MSQVIRDQFRGLKALRRASSLALPSLEWQPGLSRIQSDARQTVLPVQQEWDRLEQVLGASPKANQYGEHLSLHCWSGEPAQYTPHIQVLRLLMPGASEEVADPEQWLFLDTETTGLAGGSGTYAFLVGVAWWEGGGLEIEQFFMREYSEECSLLFALAERLAERRVLVTFNGKSFDWPLLETRYRMSRKIPLPAPRAHLDFLHPARNLWRLRLGSVRLSELERHVLGRDRGADLVSDLIPRIYLDFVRGAAPERLIPVFHHTRWTCAVSQRSPAGFFFCSAMPKPRVRMGWNCLECPASAKGGARTPVRASSTRNRLRPCCPPKRTAQRGARANA